MFEIGVKDDTTWIYHSEDPRLIAFAARKKIEMQTGWYFMNFDTNFVGPWPSFEEALRRFQDYADRI
jgi:hypothetical protein